MRETNAYVSAPSLVSGQEDPPGEAVGQGQHHTMLELQGLLLHMRRTTRHN